MSAVPAGARAGYRPAAGDAAASPRPAARPRRRRLRAAPVLAVLVSLVWLFPVYWMVCTALKPRSEALTRTPHFLPEHPTWANLVTAVSGDAFPAALRSSAVVVAATLLVAVLAGVPAAAALTRFRFRGRRALLVLVLVVQMLPGGALLVPMFLLYDSMGLLDSYPGLVLAYVGSVLPLTVWVLRGFLLAVPAELDEAAQLDGASTLQVLTRVLLPLIAPGIVATSVFAVVAAWNDYLVAYTFMSSQDHYTLPVWLASFTTPTAGTDYGAQMAASTLFSLPVVVFFLVVQRNLVSGVSAGAVKG